MLLIAYWRRTLKLCCSYVFYKTVARTSRHCFRRRLIRALQLWPAPTGDQGGRPPPDTPMHGSEDVANDHTKIDSGVTLIRTESCFNPKSGGLPLWLLRYRWMLEPQAVPQMIWTHIVTLLYHNLDLVPPADTNTT